MAVAIKAEQVYVSNGSSNSKYQGLKFHNDGLEKYLGERVNKRYYDMEGTAATVEEFSDLDLTGFERKSLVEIFTTHTSAIPWKIAETFVECFLEDYFDIKFPYNGSRDAKNPKANLTGADIVGMKYESDGLTLTFGEVKTSTDSSYPPSVVYGRTGLRYQINDLISNWKTRAGLIRWLNFRIKSLDERDAILPEFRKAVAIYIKSNFEKMKLFGVLVRDVPPDEADLKNQYDGLIPNLKSQTQLELLAFYLPIKIKDLSTKIGGISRGT